VQIPTLTAILLLAWLTEALVEYFARPWLKPEPSIEEATERAAAIVLGDDPPDDPPASLPPAVLRYIAAIVGILLAIAYHADLLALVGLVSPWSPYVGYIVTGLVIGRGSNFLHDLADRWLAPAATADPLDPARTWRIIE
jgi:hypothetical protein